MGYMYIRMSNAELTLKLNVHNYNNICVQTETKCLKLSNS